jgi:hypothetical protein
VGDGVNKFWYNEIRYGGRWDFGGQERRDQAAAVVLAYAKGGAQNLACCLYLRPFDSTDRLPVQNMSAAGMDASAQDTDFEMILRKAIERPDRLFRSSWLPTLTLIGLGYGEPMLGAGRAYSTDAEWKEAFKALAQAVRLIVAVPSAHPGTLFELSWLAEHDMWAKTILAMPEAVHPEQETIERRWNDARAAASAAGIVLPPYDRKGLLFKIDASGTVLARRPLGLSHQLLRVTNLRRAISDLRQV